MSKSTKNLTTEIIFLGMQLLDEYKLEQQTYFQHENKIIINTHAQKKTFQLQNSST